jgi:hypothetical protein
MQPYSIITLCTKNYREAYNFVIDSWLRTKAERVYVYTDDSEWQSNNDRIEIVHYFRQSNDWLLNVGKKVFCCIDSIKRQSVDTDNFIFLDIDCYITAEIGDLFDQSFDIAATRVDEPKLDTSTGFFCFRNNIKIKNFFSQWPMDQEAVRKQGRGVKEGCGAYEQIAFSELIRKMRKNRELKVLSMNADWYNRKTRLALINHEALKDSKLKVLHFYTGSFKDDACIAEVNKTFDLKAGRVR